MRCTALAAIALLLGIVTGSAEQRESTSVPLGTSPQGQNADPSNLPATVDWHRGAPPGAVPTREKGTLKPVAASWVLMALRYRSRSGEAGHVPPLATVRLWQRTDPLSSSCCVRILPIGPAPPMFDRRPPSSRFLRVCRSRIQ